MDSQLDKSNMNNVEDDLDVTAPNDLFSSNDPNDYKEPTTEDQQQHLNEDLEEATEDDVNNSADGDDNALLDAETDAPDEIVDEGTEADEADTFDLEPDSTEEDTNEAEDNNSLNLLGEDWDDLSSVGQQMGETQHDGTVSGEDDGQETLQDMENEENEEDEDEEDGTVEKTWDMTGDDVDDDQANSSVDALLDAGDEDIYNDDQSNSTNESEETQSINDNAVGENGGYNNDSQQSWNNDDDTEAELEEQEETMEQGTVEENDDDRTGDTLEQALDALEEEQEIDTEPSIIVNTDDLAPSSPVTDNTLPYDSIGKSDLPTQEEIVSSTTIGQDAADDSATVDTSLLLLIAVLILVCLRIPYVKRFFVKLFRTQDTSSTLPYHTSHNKELD